MMDADEPRCCVFAILPRRVRSLLMVCRSNVVVQQGVNGCRSDPSETRACMIVQRVWRKGAAAVCSNLGGTVRRSPSLRRALYSVQETMLSIWR